MFFYSSFGSEQDPAIALRGPVGSLSFAIVVQTVNMLNQNQALIMHHPTFLEQMKYET